jgi:hypothetical protein
MKYLVMGIVAATMLTAVPAQAAQDPAACNARCKAWCDKT